MKLTFFRGVEPNFGDELNEVLWGHLLPAGFLDKSERELFLGVGSILWDNLPKQPIKHVLGSGYGGYTPPPNVKDGKWNIVWVRGPMTAKALGIDPSLAITDAAVLLRAIPLPEPEPGIDVAFMPHFESISRGNWAGVCELAGITYLDPRESPMSLIAKIRGTRLLLTEAMHGAIVADALRTPYIPFIPHHPQHRMKWDDWAASVGLTLKKETMPVSTLVDLYVRQTGKLGKGRTSQLVRTHPLLKPCNHLLTHSAAAQLQNLANYGTPMLSDQSAVDSLTERCMSALNRFIKANN